MSQRMLFFALLCRVYLRALRILILLSFIAARTERDAERSAERDMWAEQLKQAVAAVHAEAETKASRAQV